MEGTELCKHAQRRKCKSLWPNEKRGKNEKRHFLLFAKREKIKDYYFFLNCDFQKPLASMKKPIFWLFIFGLFFLQVLFLF